MSVDKKNDYSFISVHADEEDDIVIQAGVNSRSAQSVQIQETHTAQDESQVQEVEAREDNTSTYAVEASENTRATQGLQTTEDDLRADVPYSSMHKTIVVVFILFLVAAILYWFFLR